MTDSEQREAARQFANRWNGRGNEDEDGRSYWLELLTEVLGLEHATAQVNFEKKVVVNGNTKRIDAYLPETHVLIEQKSRGKRLDQKIHNSGDIELTPYEQAKRYNDNLPYDEKARWIITSNFEEIWIYDMNLRIPEPVKILLMELPSKYPLLSFLVRQDIKKLSREMEVSIQAGDIVGLLYDAFLKQYKNPEREETLKSLNVLCVRMVFCLYAEDAGIFGRRAMFHDYMASFETPHMRSALKDLFRVLDEIPEKRDPYLIPSLAEFPYVNGGLFADETIEIPMFTDEIRELLLVKASENFNWSEISPTIFGAIFESTLNPETRRSGGMHYTSIENIHKVIDPLFLDDFRKELEEIKAISVVKTRNQKLADFQSKLAALEFLDPASGSGNFLTETYVSIRRLENEAISARFGGQMTIGDVSNPIQVSIRQFHGIEINDFAVTVAKTALWIAESQMMQETENILYGRHLEFLPLKTNANIVEANALRIDWNEVIPAEKLDYIMGNPPFVGARLMDASQKEDVNSIFENWKNAGNLDYVCCWYKKAADYMTGTKVTAALVSTNSVAQGENVGNLWKPLFEEGVQIRFAHRTFRWDSEAAIKAHVHCVIIGFTKNAVVRDKKIYDGDEITQADNINGYLLNAENICVESRNRPICNVPEIGIGNKPIDGGYYLFEKEEMEAFLKIEPAAKDYFRPWYGSREFINQSPRYCLWLGDCTPGELRKMPECMKRVQAVRNYRMQSTSAGTRKLAERPTRFHVENMPKGTYIVIPEVSSERRRYIPIGFMSSDILCSNLVKIVPNASLYHFGILASNIHMAWTRVVCGRLKSDYRYSKDVVYNNFPWPNPTGEQLQRIETTAQQILDARLLYPESSLADLYDPIAMPTELRKAHIANDKAAMAVYGFSTKMSEEDCVAELMRLYKDYVENRLNQ